MTDNREADAFGADVEALEGAMAEAGAMTAALSGEIQKMQGAMAATGRDAEVLSKGLSRGLKSAFDGLVFDGMRASDALGAVARSLVNT
ncbi:MAG: phage tail tape measure protein, partial [Silicimonas sp.]|nr:phage tail tape measure protein [Silicimonas sp.]